MKKISLIIFYDENKNILIQDRKSISKYGEFWGYFGGKIELNETPTEAIIRETKEELCYDLKEFKYVGSKQYNFQNKFSVKQELFIAPLKDNLKKFKVEEGDGMLLCSISKAKILLSKYDVKTLNYIKRLI